MSDQIRLWGAMTRKDACAVQTQFGAAVGLNYCNRNIWELAEVLAEFQDREFAAETLYRIGDQIVGKFQPSEIQFIERKDAPPPAAALEPPPAPKPSWLQALRWLRDHWLVLLGVATAYALGLSNAGVNQ